ncbi:MAG: LemA family protein [Pirellulaceae bacterium]
MLMWMIIGFVVATFALIVTTQVVTIYNKLVRLDNECENSFGQIEIQLKRRYDLIPNLVETVRSYMKHESETLERVIAARNQASQGLSSLKNSASPEAMQQWIGAESNLMGALGKMNFVMEDYPELKADTSVAALVEELTSTENRISFARQAYNDWCTTFNVFRQSFPNVLFAANFGYSEERTLLEFEDSAEIQAAPKVELAGV